MGTPIIYFFSVTPDEPDVNKGPVTGQELWELDGRWGDSEYSTTNLWLVLVTLVRVSSASVLYFGVLLEILFHALTCSFT